MIAVIRTERRRPDGTITPPLPEDDAWMERVNQGALFRLDQHDQLLGSRGEPFVRLPLAKEGEEGYSFHELALYLYNCSIGALLCHPDKGIGDGFDHLPLSYGDIVDFIQTGKLTDRIPVTPPWGYPDGFLQDESNPRDTTPPDLSKLPSRLYEPDLFILPKRLRVNMAWFFRQVDAQEVAISLLRAPNGTQTLFLLYRLSESGMKNTELQQYISQRLMWYLPRHYAALILASSRVEGYKLLP